MDFSDRVLGKTIASQLQDRVTSPVLQIGSDRFTRQELSNAACFNFTAAARLSKLLAEFPIKNTKDVFERIAPASLAVPLLGSISLAVLGAAFEHMGLGGSHPLESWMAKHGPKLLTFTSIKTAQRKREDAVRRRRRKRRIPAA